MLKFSILLADFSGEVKKKKKKSKVYAANIYCQITALQMFLKDNLLKEYVVHYRATDFFRTFYFKKHL